MSRPHFTIRLILIVTTIAAVLAWQFGGVWHRRVALKSGPTFVLAREAPGESQQAIPTVSAFRAFLGDEPVRFIYVAPEGDYEAQAAGLRRLFPEAQVVAGLPELEIP